MGRFWTSTGGAGPATSIPIYTTRTSAAGETGSLSMSLWMALLAMLLVWANVVAWGFYGLYSVVRAVV